MRLIPSEIVRRLLLAALVLTSAGGCGVAQRTAYTTTLPIVRSSLLTAYRNGDVQLVAEALPANIVLLEGLAETRPDDPRALALTCQLYVSYALAFVETGNPERAQALYERGLALGFRAFPALEPSAYPGPDGEVAYEVALERLGLEDAGSLLWLAAAWANTIKDELGDPFVLAELPRLEQLAAHVVELDPTYLHGMPNVLLGTIRTYRPPYLGGDPEAAEAAFQRAFEASERRFLIAHLFYARYYCRQSLDVDCFDETLDELLNADPTALPDAVLLNKVAQAQGRALLALRDELF